MGIVVAIYDGPHSPYGNICPIYCFLRVYDIIYGYYCIIWKIAYIEKFPITDSGVVTTHDADLAPIIHRYQFFYA